MDIGKVIKELLWQRRMSQETLAKAAGYKSQTNVTSFINRSGNKMKVSSALSMLQPLNAELIVRDKVTGQEFKVDDEPTFEEVFQERQYSDTVSKIFQKMQKNNYR